MLVPLVLALLLLLLLPVLLLPFMLTAAVFDRLEGVTAPTMMLTPSVTA
jgi:hypothetical protein